MGGWTDYREDRQTEEQTLFHRNLLFWPCPGFQQQNPQTKSQIKHCLTTKHCKRYLSEIDMIQGQQDVVYVRRL